MTTGWHYIAVTEGAGDYDITAEVYRPALEGTRPVQTLLFFGDWHVEQSTTGRT